MAKQTSPTDPLVTLSVRVTRQTARRLREISEASYRPVAAEMRRLIEERVERADAELLGVEPQSEPVEPKATAA